LEDEFFIFESYGAPISKVEVYPFKPRMLKENEDLAIDPYF
jgi:hypothetical protein